MNKKEKNTSGRVAPTETLREAGRKAFVVPACEARGDLQIHFCSGINLWDGAGTLQCN